MIRILGLKRIIWLVCCLFLMAGVGAGIYYYFLPEMERNQNEIRKVEGQIQLKRAQIQTLKLEYAQLRDQIVKFNKIKQVGFFNAQDSVTAREMIKALTSQAHLLRTTLNLLQGFAVDNPQARETGYSLISRPMTVKLQSLDDINAYKFVVALQSVFPGYLEFKNLTLKRSRELDRDILKSIAAGNPSPLIEGTAEFVWWSMASQKQMAANPYFNPAAMPATPSLGAPDQERGVLP